MSGGFRRTWDKDHYKAKALERLERGENYEDDEDDSKINIRKDKEEFKPASNDAAGPMGSERAFIKARSDKLGLEDKIGRTEVVKPVAGNTAGGFFCEVCKCLLKDSSSYLDHVNGKKHQRALGFSMRVERANVSDVKDKLESLKRKSESITTTISAIDKYNNKIEKSTVDMENMKKAKKEREAALKAEKIAAELESMDPEMAALMGFGGFK